MNQVQYILDYCLCWMAWVPQILPPGLLQYKFEQVLGFIIPFNKHSFIQVTLLLKNSHSTNFEKSRACPQISVNFPGMFCFFLLSLTQFSFGIILSSCAWFLSHTCRPTCGNFLVFKKCTQMTYVLANLTDALGKLGNSTYWEDGIGIGAITSEQQK